MPEIMIRWWYAIDRQMDGRKDGQKKWHLEVGAPVYFAAFQGFKTYCRAFGRSRTFAVLSTKTTIKTFITWKLRRVVGCGSFTVFVHYNTPHNLKLTELPEEKSNIEKISSNKTSHHLLGVIQKKYGRIVFLKTKSKSSEGMQF